MTIIHRIGADLAAIAFGIAAVCLMTAAAQAESLDNAAVSASAAHATHPAKQQRSRPWSIEDALPRHSKAVDANETTSPAGEFGRIRLRNGTLGLETKSQIDPYKTPESRRLPGLEVNSNKPSYLGLSLSVPSSDKLFSLPAPGLGPNPRPE